MRIKSHVLKMDATPFEFSTNGEFAIHASHDGVLIVWETATNTVKNDYKPSSHLSASCCCLSWCQKLAVPVSAPKKKRRKSGSNVSSAITELNLVAVGTVTGNILLYSVVKGDLHSQLIDGHSDSVNGICWYTEQNTLYSCSSDHHICEWSITNSKLKHKWKADKGAVYSVCKCSSNHLLSAGRSIKLWDLTTKEVLKTFTGHATEVFKLTHFPVAGNSEDPNSVEGSYFISAAVNDRLVNAWQINTTSTDKNALASFSLPDEPVSMHVTSYDKQKPAVLVVVTKCGKALIYEHTLNGKLQKPLKPKVVIKITSDRSDNDVAHPIQILAAYVCREDLHKLMLVHGNTMKPTFEKVTYNKSEPEMCLTRQDPTRTVVKKETGISKVKTPMVSKDMNVLVPSHMAPAQLTQEPVARRKRKLSAGDMSMEERLNAISLNSAGGVGDGKQLPKADSLVTMLVQGLQSRDTTSLDNVLQNSDHNLIKKTVQKLPLQMIIPLVQELSKRMFGGVNKGIVNVRWIKTLLEVHTSYLMTFPEIIDTFSSLYQMMDSRVNTLGRLLKLQGRLDIMLSQITTQTKEEPTTSQQPLLQFDEESSDEDLDELGLWQAVSDSEDIWEDISSDDTDMEAEEDGNSKG